MELFILPPLSSKQVKYILQSAWRSRGKMCCVNEKYYFLLKVTLLSFSFVKS